MGTNTLILYAYIDDEKNLREKIEKRLDVQNKTSEYFIGRLLLSKGLSQLNVPFNINQIKYSDFGRPYIENTKYFIDFNISHSKNMVACIVSKSCIVGIDVEKMKTIDIYNFKDHFSKKEWILLEEEQNPLTLFYKLWTRKEAILKANGFGLSFLLSKIEVLEDYVYFNKEIWYFNTLSLKSDYYTCFVTNKPEQVLLKKINIDKFF